MQKRKGPGVLIFIGIVFIVLSIGLFMWEISSMANQSTVSMQIYNLEVDAWESITFASANAISTPIWGVMILIIGMFPLVFGMIWKLVSSKFNISIKNSKGDFFENLQYYVNLLFVPVFNHIELPEILFNPVHTTLKNDFVEEYLCTLPIGLKRIEKVKEFVREAFRMLGEGVIKKRIVAYFALFQGDGIELLEFEENKKRIFGETVFEKYLLGKKLKIKFEKQHKIFKQKIKLKHFRRFEFFFDF